MMPKIPQKLPKTPGKCRHFGFAYYAESNARIFRLALAKGERGAGGAQTRGVHFRAAGGGRGLHSFPFPLNLSLLCPFPLNLSSLYPPCNPT